MQNRAQDIRKSYGRPSVFTASTSISRMALWSSLGLGRGIDASASAMLIGLETITSA